MLTREDGSLANKDANQSVCPQLGPIINKHYRFKCSLKPNHDGPHQAFLDGQLLEIWP